MENIIKNTKGKLQTGKKMFPTHISEKGLVSRKKKKKNSHALTLSNPNIRRRKNPIKKREKYEITCIRGVKKKKIRK